MSKRFTSIRLATILGLSLVLAAATPPAESPVADAAQANDVEQLRTLLQQGADVNAAQPDGLTALHWAALNDNVEVAKLLLYAGATVRPHTRVGGYTPLHLAARSGNAAALGALLDAGARADEWTSTGVTSVHFAAQANSSESLRLLAEHGADLDAADRFQGRTPLMFASGRNAVDAVAALIELGADPSITTELKDYVARSEFDDDDRAKRSRVRAAQNGEEPRGDPRMPPNLTPGQEPPDSAAADSTGAAPDAEEAEEAEAKKEEKPEEPPVRALSGDEQIGVQGGMTALHYAARQGHIEAAKLLIEGAARRWRGVVERRIGISAR